MRHEVKVSLAEEAELQRRADAADVTVVRWMVEAALGDTSNQRKATNTARASLLAQLTGIGKNIRRIGIAVESGTRAPEEFVSLLTAWHAECRAAIDALRAEQD